MSDSMTAPAASARILGLDVTRGFAVMGILAMNIIGFAMPENAYLSPLVWGGTGPVDMAAWATAFVLADSKMRGLFSILFGASTLLVIQSAEAAGRDARETHYARMLTLGLFGLIHYYAIWYGDILFSYAVMGLLLYPLRRQGTRTLAITGVALIAVSTLLFAVQFVGLRLAATFAVTPEAVEGYQGFVAMFSGPDDATLAELALMTGSYAGIFADRAVDQLFYPLISLVQFGMETLGLMCLGMALFKGGMFSGDWSLARLDRWRTIGLGLGIVVNLALLGWQFASGMDGWVVVTTTLIWSVPFDVAMSIGYAALFMGLAQRAPTHPLVQRVAAAGRAAFSNYLGTSIVMTTIFYGYGLGLFGSIARAPLYLFVLAAWAVMLLWSKPWLDRYRYGPLEWLWRSLARRQVQPLRRA